MPTSQTPTTSIRIDPRNDTVIVGTAPGWAKLSPISSISRGSHEKLITRGWAFSGHAFDARIPAQSLNAENAQLQYKFIVVKSVEAPAEGWLVAHKEEGGQPGDIVGFMMIKSGNNSEV